MAESTYWENRVKVLSALSCGVGLVFCLATGVMAQTQVVPIQREIVLRSPAELDEMLSWIALYPDPLLAVLLPAATFPGDLVLANRYLAAGGDPENLDGQGWDSSVAALSRYPDVLRWMDDNLSWTIALGETFLSQPQDVMGSIQRLRARAQTLGNLQSTPESTLFNEDGIIEILPANPENIYVPSYDSQVIYIHSSQGAAITRRTGFKTGLWLNHDFDWPNRRIIVWGKEQSRPSGWWSYSSSKRSCLGEVHPKPWQRRGHGMAAEGNRPPATSTPNVGTGGLRSSVTVIGGKGGSGSGRMGAGLGHGSAVTVLSGGSSGGRASAAAGGGKAGSSGQSSGATRSPAPASGPAPAASSK